LSKVPVVVDAGKSSGVDAAGECDPQRWQPYWVAISYAHKRIAIIDLCRPLDAYEDQLEAAATLKQGGYSPLLRALDFYTKQGWVIHVFPWMVGILGLLHPTHICALLQFLEVPHQHWPLAVERTVLASVNAFYFLHSVRFGSPSEGGPCATGRDCAEQEAYASDSSDLEELRACKDKRGSPWSSGAGAIPQRAPKLLKHSSQTTVYILRVPLISAAG
jgi:hypothetical protein